MKNLIVNADDFGWTAKERGATAGVEAIRARDMTDTGILNLVASQGIRLIDYALVAQEA